MANEKKSVDKQSPSAGEKSGNSDKYSELMTRQWGDTTEERAKYQAEHQKDIDRIVEARKRELDAEDRAVGREE
jgi:hypothetical protein